MKDQHSCCSEEQKKGEEKKEKEEKSQLRSPPLLPINITSFLLPFWCFLCLFFQRKTCWEKKDRMMTSTASPVIISSWNSFLCKYWMRMRKFSFCRRLQSSPVIPSQLFLHNILSFVNLVFFKHHLPSSSSLLTHSLLSPSSSWSTCLLSQNLSYEDNWTWNLWNQRVPETWSNPEKKRNTRRNTSQEQMKEENKSSWTKRSGVKSKMTKTKMMMRRKEKDKLRKKKSETRTENRWEMIGGQTKTEEKRRRVSLSDGNLVLFLWFHLFSSSSCSRREVKCSDEERKEKIGFEVQNVIFSLRERFSLCVSLSGIFFVYLC